MLKMQSGLNILSQMYYFCQDKTTLNFQSFSVARYVVLRSCFHMYKAPKYVYLCTLN